MKKKQGTRQEMGRPLPWSPSKRGPVKADWAIPAFSSEEPPKKKKKKKKRPKSAVPFSFGNKVLLYEVTTTEKDGEVKIEKSPIKENSKLGKKLKKAVKARPMSPQPPKKKKTP